MMEGIGTAVSTLLIVILVIYLSYVGSKMIGKGFRGKRNTRYMNMVDQLVVGQDKSIAIIKVGPNYYMVGITNNGITLLSNLEEEDLIELPIENMQMPESVKSFRNIVEKVENYKNQKKQ